MSSIPICRRVWFIAARWPELWSTIHIDSPHIRPPLSDKKFGLLDHKLWLERCLQRGVKTGYTVYLERTVCTSHARELAPLTRELHLTNIRESSDLQGLDEEATPSLPWPLLKSLHVNTMNTRQRFVIRSGLLLGVAASLTVLRLTGHRHAYDVEDFPTMPNLQYLCVQHLVWRPNSAARWNMIFATHQALVEIDLNLLYDPPIQGFISEPSPVASSLSYLDCLRLEGASGLVCAVFEMLPNPLRELSLIMPAQSTSPEQEQVIQRATAFLRGSRGLASTTTHEIIFESQKCHVNAFRIQPLQVLSSSPLLTLKAACEHRAPLSELLQYVSVVKFHAHFNFDLIFTALERSQSRAKELHINSRLVNRWGRLPMVERYLRHRKDEGCPLDILRIDAPTATPLDEHYNIPDLGLHIRWLKQGLVRGAVMVDNDSWRLEQILSSE